VQICCGLCIYRRQYGLRVCCGNDDDDDVTVTSAGRRGAAGPRKTHHVVLAAQYNRAFGDLDESILCPAVIGDQSATSSVKVNGGVVAVNDSSAADPLFASDYELDHRDLGSTAASADSDCDAPIEINSRDVAADAATDSAVSPNENNFQDTAEDKVDTNSDALKENNIVTLSAGNSQHGVDEKIDGNCEALKNSTVAPSESNSHDATVDVEDVDQKQENVADDDVQNNAKAATVNDDNNERTDALTSERTSADEISASDDCMTSYAGNDELVTSFNDERPDAATADDHASLATTITVATQTPDRSEVTDEYLRPTSKTHEPAAIFRRIQLPEAHSNSRKKTSPFDRRWRSMGAGTRQRRMVDTATSCDDKAVDVHEVDLRLQPEPEIVADNEVDAMSENATNEENRKEEEMIDAEKKIENRLNAAESNVNDHRTLDNLVLDIDDIGLLNTLDAKQEEVSSLSVYRLKTRTERRS